MRFDLTDEQRAVRDAIDGLWRSRWGARAMRGYVDGDDDGEALWSELAGAGWAGAAVAEEHGGQGLGTVELTLVSEGLGRALAPGAWFGHAAAALLISAAGDDTQRRRWLPGLAGGETRAAMATVRPDGSAVAYDAARADVLVILSPGGAAIARAGDCRLSAVDGIDLTRRLSRFDVQHAEELRGAEAIGAVVDRLEVALAAELVGVAGRAMDLAVEHARTREQFGHPIGVYQAVSHRCADMLLDVESARSAVLFAAWTADNDSAGLPFAASVAKVAAAQGAWRVTTSALQVHGGIGFTWEHDCHLLLRRAAASGRLLGSTDAHLDRISELHDLRSAAVAAAG